VTYGPKRARFPWPRRTTKSSKTGSKTSDTRDLWGYRLSRTRRLIRRLIIHSRGQPLVRPADCGAVRQTSTNGEALSVEPVPCDVSAVGDSRTNTHYATEHRQRRPLGRVGESGDARDRNGDFAAAVPDARARSVRGVRDGPLGSRPVHDFRQLRHHPGRPEVRRRGPVSSDWEAHVIGFYFRLAIGLAAAGDWSTFWR